MNDRRLPTISVAIATYNSGKTLDRSLKTIRQQNYPQEKIEIILGDGGSTDDTPKIAKKYKARVVPVPPEKQSAEYNRGVAFNEAKNDLVLIYDHDNFLPYKNWLRDMVNPLLEHPNMVATETCYYHYSKRYNTLDRYFALFGASEPLPIFLGKADRLPQTSKTWTLLGEARDMGKYYVVHFERDPRKFPTIGTNGCLMWRELVQKNAKASPEYHYPIDVMFDVVKKGYNEFGFVKNSIIHLTSHSGFWPFLMRRKKFVDDYHFRDYSKRRYSVVMPGDGPRVALYVLYSLTLVGPIWHALKGFIRIPDRAWFLHPLMCIGSTFIYGYSTFKLGLLGKLKA